MQSAYYDGASQDAYGRKVDSYWLPNHVFKPYVNGASVDRPPADPVAWKAANLDKLPNAFRGDPQSRPAPEHEQGAETTRQSRFRLWSVEELRDREPPVWVLDEIVPQKGYAILYGPAGSFKTFLALDMGLCVAHGCDWNGRNVRQGRVLYVMGEGSFDAHERVDAWLRHRGCKIDSSRFRLIEPAPMLAFPEDVKDFFGAAGAGGPWDLVIVDTIGRVMPGVDDYHSMGARTFTSFVSNIRDKLGAATLALTHSPKDKPETLLGSQAYEADADTIYNLTVSRKGELVNLR